MSSKSHKYNDDIIDSLEKENKLLKEKNRSLSKENSQLRKQLNSYNQVTMDQRVQEYLSERQKDQDVKKERKILFKKWECYECQRGVLVIREYSTAKFDKYYRSCSNTDCGFQTKPKNKHEDVVGIYPDDLIN